MTAPLKAFEGVPSPKVNRLIVKMRSENPHLKRSIEYVEKLANRDNAKVDLRFNARNYKDLDSVVDFCRNAADRTLDERDSNRLAQLSKLLYESSKVDKVSGFYAYEPDLETMNSIRILLMHPEECLMHYNNSLAETQTRELIIEYTFCSDTKEEVPLEPNVQFGLFDLLAPEEGTKYESEPLANIKKGKKK